MPNVKFKVIKKVQEYMPGSKKFKLQVLIDGQIQAQKEVFVIKYGYKIICTSENDIDTLENIMQEDMRQIEYQCDVTPRKLQSGTILREPD